MVYLKSLDFTTQESPSSTRWGGSNDTIIDNFEIHYPTPNEIETAMECVLKYDGTLALADCLAITIMKKREITEIISFDDDFDKIKGIIRVH